MKDKQVTKKHNIIVIIILFKYNKINKNNTTYHLHHNQQMLDQFCDNWDIQLRLVYFN